MNRRHLPGGAPPSIPIAVNHGPVHPRRIPQPPSRENPWRRLLVLLGIAALNLVQFTLADSPHQWWVWVLLALNVGFSLMRLIPDEQLTDPLVRMLSIGSIVSAAGLMSIDPHGVAAAFGYFFAGHVGYRRPDREGIAWAALMSIAGASAVLLGDQAHLIEVPWYVGALTGLPVFIGIANRNRVEALAAAQQAVQSAAIAVEARADAATLVERNRIARELHDVLAHSLAGVNLQLEAVDALLEAGKVDRARRAVGTAQELVRVGMREAGTAVRALREDTRPLIDRINTAVLTSAPEGTRLDVSGEPVELSELAVSAVQRAVQESLTNARKYAPGAVVAVQLDQRPERVVLRVTNAAVPPGVPSIATGTGLGLLGMRERLGEVGGTVRSGPIAGGPSAGGWRVEVSVPVGDQHVAAAASEEEQG